jgi:aminopeptidase-like protein
MAMLWTLAYADGSTSLLEISEISGMPFAALRDAAAKLSVPGLLVEE